MRIDSQEYRLIWLAAMLSLIGQGVAVVLLCDMLPGAALMAGGLILLNLSCFAARKYKRIFACLMLLLQVTAVILCPYWFIGLLAVPAITCTWLFNRKACHLMNLIFALGGWIMQIVRTDITPVSALLYLGIIVAAFAIWETVIYFLFRSASTSEKLRAALTAAAVEALEQRSLREEIAKNQKVNENNARLEERERISRDIHNYVGHTLSAATVTLDAASLLVPSDKEKALEKIDSANSRVHEAISSVRSVVRTLDAEDDRIALDDYLLSLEKMIDEFKSDTSYKVYHNFSQAKSKTRIPIQTASFLSSSLSELLTNGVKHGHADLFVITFILDTGHIRLKVQDNGTGWGKLDFNEKKLRLNNGFGLRKIRDYTEGCGGSFEIESEDGFAVNLSLPFEEENT
jgi:signal transduction histidine kinase